MIQTILILTTLIFSTLAGDLYPSDVLGTQVSVGTVGLNYLATTATPLLIQAIEEAQIGKEDIKKDGFEFTLSSLKLKDVEIDSIELTLSDSGIDIVVQGIALKCSGDYGYELEIWPHEPKGSGDFDATIGSDSHIKASIEIEQLTQRTVLELSNCKSKFDVKSVHFGGGITSDILNLFKDTVEKDLQSTIDSVVCDAMNDLISETNSSMLLDFTLCSVRNGALACELDLNYGMGTGPFSSDHFLPLEAPGGIASVNIDQELSSSYHVELIAELFPVNYLILCKLYKLKLVDIYLTQSMLDAKNITIIELNTNTFKEIAPVMYERWPDTEVQIELNATDTPSLSQSSGSLVLTFDASWSFQVRDPEIGLQTAFTLAATDILTVTPKVKENATLMLDVDALDCTDVALASSEVGNVNVSSVKAYFEFACNSIALPELKKLVKTLNISLNSLSSEVQFVNPSISVKSIPVDSTSNDDDFTDAIVFVSNVSYTKTSSKHNETKRITNQTSERRLAPPMKPHPKYIPRVTPYGASLSSNTIDITKEPYNAVPFSFTARANNTMAINRAFVDAAEGDTILIPAGNTFFFNGGIEVLDKTNIGLQIEGAMRAVPDFEAWPLRNDRNYAHFIYFENCTGVTITSSTEHGQTIGNDKRSLRRTSDEARALVDGQGKRWWNEYTIGPSGPSRPKLIVLSTCENILVENIFMLNSPSFNLLLDDVLHAEVRRITVFTDKSVSNELEPSVAPRGAEALYRASHLQLEDLNTDGFDPKGRDVWFHDSHINNDDDSIAVKPCDQQCTFSDCSEDMLFENLVLIGFGASIGSVPPHPDHNCVRNITFRNISMPGTGKGVYIKSNPGCDKNITVSGEISNIVYEDINITNPFWWPIWIGPQQQNEPDWTPDQRKRSCSLFYPFVENCPVPGCVTFENITLRRINISDSVLSPGIILGNNTNPMKNIVLDSVHVTRPGTIPFYGGYQCEFTSLSVLGSTNVVPDCDDMEK